MGNIENQRWICGKLLLIALSVSGCAGALGNVMVSSPNRFNPFVRKSPLPAAAQKVLGVDQQIRVQVGPPEATLAVSVIEPKDNAAPKGTVLVLHGFWIRSFWMLHTANALADAGYRAVLVDLRGHGESTGRYLTYGRQEKKDLSQVIDELERRNLITGKLGVYGYSYGAATSIHLAGHDPRIQAVVAVAPFSRMRDAVSDFGRTMLPGVERMLSEDRVQRGVDSGSEQAHFDPNANNAVDSIRQTKAPVLILHGTDDWVVPPYHGKRLYEAGSDHTELRLIPQTGHIGIWFDTDGKAARQAREWFDRHLSDEPPRQAAGVVRIRG